MAYSTNPATVDSRLEDDLLGPGLDSIARGSEYSWHCTRDPLITQRVARQLRETLNLAGKHPMRFPQLAAAAEVFTITVIRDGLVEAKYKSVPKTETSVSNNTPITGLEPQGKPVATVSLVTAEQVIDSWRAHLPSSDPIHLTKVNLNPDEMFTLWQWAVRHTPKLMLLADESRHTLTVSHLDPSVVEFAWSPPQPAVEPEEELDV